MIRQQGKTFSVRSESGKNLGSGYSTKGQAQKRLAQVEWFKAHPSKKRK